MSGTETALASLTTDPLPISTGLADTYFVTTPDPLADPPPTTSNPPSSGAPDPSALANTQSGNAGGSVSTQTSSSPPASTPVAAPMPTNPPPVVPPPTGLPTNPTPPNPPHASDDAYSFSGSTLTVKASSGLLANDTNPTGQPMTASIVDAPVYGSVSLNPDGSFVYLYDNPVVPHAVTFTYQAVAGGLVSNVATVTLNYVLPTFTWAQTPPGTPSITNPGNQTGVEGQAVSLPIAAAGNGPFQYAALELPTGLKMNAATGVISGTSSSTAAEDLDGNYTTTVIVSEADGGSSTTQFAWVISPPPTLANPGDQSSIAGTSVSLPLDAYGPNGDGLTFSALGLPIGTTIDSGTGVISGTIDAAASGSFGVTVSVQDAATGASDSQTFNWAVTTASQPPASPGYQAPTMDPVASQTNAAGDFVDFFVTASGSNPLTFSGTGLPSGLSIDSTTGEIIGTLSNSSSSSTPYQVTVSATDGTNTACQSFAWTVQPATLPVSQSPPVVSPFTATEGNDTSLVSVATFTADPRIGSYDFTATIAWGDGTSDAALIDAQDGLFTVMDDHTYAASGQYSLSVTVTGPDGTSFTSNAMESVTPATVTPITGFQVGALVGQAGEVVTEFEYNNPLVSATGFTAWINPGDGSGIVPRTIASVGDGLYSVSLPQGYALAQPDAATITVTDPHDVQTVIASTVEVGNLVVGEPANLTVASFIVGDQTAQASSYTAIIDWGDGTTPSVGTVTGAAGVFAVAGSHTYLADSIDVPGGYTVTVSLLAAGQAVETASHNVVVTRPTMTGQIAHVVVATDGTVTNQTIAAFEVPNTTDVASWFQATIDWGDGTTSEGTISGGNGLFTITGAHAYVSAGDHVVQVTIDQRWGASQVATLLKPARKSTGGWIASVVSDLSGKLPAGVVSQIETALRNGVGLMNLLSQLRGQGAISARELRLICESIARHRPATFTFFPKAARYAGPVTLLATAMIVLVLNDKNTAEPYPGAIKQKGGFERQFNGDTTQIWTPPKNDLGIYTIKVSILADGTYTATFYDVKGKQLFGLNPK